MKSIRIFCLGLALVAPARASAITCTFTSTTPVSFGAYDVYSSTPVDAAGGVTLSCSGVLPADNITVDMSAGGASSFSPRTLDGPGTDTLNYNLYLNAGRTTVWGDGTGVSTTQGPLNPAEGSNSYSIYGRVPGGQDARAGTYSDTVTVTVNF